MASFVFENRLLQIMWNFWMLGRSLSVTRPVWERISVQLKLNVVADWFEAGRRHVASWNLAYHLAH